MKHTSGCTCCNCQERLVFFDDAESEEMKVYEGQPASFEYVARGGWANPPGGLGDGGHVIRVKEDEIGTKYQWRTIPIPKKKNLRVSVYTAIDFTVDDLGTMGIFIGGVARIFYSDVSGKVFLQWPVDGEGNPFGYSQQKDMGFGGIVNPHMRITVDMDWNELGHVFFFAVGGGTGFGLTPNAYAGEVFGSGLVAATVNVGMFGTARMSFDNFSIYRSQTGNNRCQKCFLCDQDHITKAYDLSVPELASSGEDGCPGCIGLSGDWILTYSLYWNTRKLNYSVSCGWHTPDSAEYLVACDDDSGDVNNIPGVAWHLSAETGVWRLQASNARNILMYVCPLNEFVCGEANTFTLDESFQPCGFGVACCSGAPETLTLIPRIEP